MKVKRTIADEKLSVYAEKERIAKEVYGGKCYVCELTYHSGHAFHHLEYDSLRKTHKDFTYSWQYNNYIFPEVLDFPARFVLLCRICHARIDQPRYGYLGHLDDARLTRLFEVARNTKPAPRGKKQKDKDSKQMREDMITVSSD